MCLFYEYVHKCNLRLSVPVKSPSPFSFGGSTVDRDQHVEHALVRQVDHHTIRDDCKRKVISQVKYGSAGRFRISHLWGRLTEVGSSHVLFRGHDAGTPSSVRNSDGGAAGSMEMWQTESQTTCQAITIYLAWNSISSFLDATCYQHW